MKNKVINLFGNTTIGQNDGVKYSQILEQFMVPFASDFDDEEYYEDVIDFVVIAWNFGNMKIILPKEESDVIINSINDKDVDVDLLKRMIDFKVKKFKQYPNFIVDYEVGEQNGDPLLTVVTQEQDDYLESMFDDMESESSEEDFEENYINRSAVILKPLQPFLDWLSILYPDEISEINETTTYLINEEITNVDAWLRKKFDKLFMKELEGWHTNKKDWPQKRNYKMFKQWFQVDISRMVYDLEMEPVLKG